MNYWTGYTAELLDAIHSIDLGKVDQVIGIFKEARAHGRRIFVCGDDGMDSVASHLLCEMVMSASSDHPSRFRMFALCNEPPWNAAAKEAVGGRVFVEQLRKFAEPDDVVVVINTSSDSLKAIHAMEYASWIGCRTISITNCALRELNSTVEVNFSASTSQISNKDTQLIICHMIGYYFAHVERTRNFSLINPVKSTGPSSGSGPVGGEDGEEPYR